MSKERNAVGTPVGRAADPAREACPELDDDEDGTRKSYTPTMGL